MKTTSTLFFLSIFTFSFGQDISFKQLSKETSGKTYTSYTASDGHMYKIGDKITLGRPSNANYYLFCQAGNELAPSPLGAANMGNTLEIKKIKVRYFTGDVHVWMTTSNSVTAMVNNRIDFEKALQSGEVVGQGYTSDQALAELKKAKDKLDLGLISQAKFDSLKTELAKFIK